MNPNINNLFEVGYQYGLNFQISEKMVKRFSELTGDCSSLHINKSFGRRSIYRKNVAHGMLTVAHLSLLDFLSTDDFRFFVRKISASFLKPVFIDDSLSLSAVIKEFQQSQGQVVLEYLIKKIESDMPVVTGFLILDYSNDANKKEQIGLECNPRIFSKEGMVTTSLVENIWEFSQIKENQEERFSFKVTRDCAYALFDILAMDIVKKEKHARWLIKNVNANFLTTMLFSTFAGMCIPGRYATIMNFEAKFDEGIQWNKVYDFIGRVVFKSSMSSISQKISIKDSQGDCDTVCARGEINIRVNSPSVTMPSIADLRARALDLQLENKVVLITGASRGIGETTAKLFSLYGAKVAVNYLNGRDDAERIVKEITGSGGAAIAVCADVSNGGQVRAMVKIICAEFGAIDILVNNAVSNAFESEFMTLSWEEVQKDIDVIVRGAFNCCKEVIPHMIRNGQGKIINVSTVYTDNPPAHQVKYVVAKSGLVGLTRGLAAELASRNIQVNMVVPSVVETDLTAGINKMVLKGMIQNTPMKRLASSVDVARAIVFLASSLNSFTTGQKIMVTGGNAPFL